MLLGLTEWSSFRIYTESARDGELLQLDGSFISFF